MDHCIKFRPTPPRSPYLNGKVERSQLTDLQEFWPRFKPKHPATAIRIEEWQFDYNYRRGHGSLEVQRPLNGVRGLKVRFPCGMTSSQVMTQRKNAFNLAIGKLTKRSRNCTALKRMNYPAASSGVSNSRSQ